MFHHRIIETLLGKSILPFVTDYLLTLLPVNDSSLLLYYFKVWYFCYFYVKFGRAGANISLFVANVPSCQGC